MGEGKNARRKRILNGLSTFRLLPYACVIWFTTDASSLSSIQKRDIH